MRAKPLIQSSVAQRHGHGGKRAQSRVPAQGFSATGFAGDEATGLDELDHRQDHLAFMGSINKKSNTKLKGDKFTSEDHRTSSFSMNV